MSPASISATKMSPLGATRSRRGPERPVANASTVNPGGTFGVAPLGRGTMLPPSATLRVA